MAGLLRGRVKVAPRQLPALLGGHVEEVPDEGGGLPRQEGPQLPRQRLLVQPEAAQAAHDPALREGHVPPAVSAQHLVQPQLQRPQDLAVVAE